MKKILRYTWPLLAVLGIGIVAAFAPENPEQGYYYKSQWIPLEEAGDAYFVRFTTPEDRNQFLARAKSGPTGLSVSTTPVHDAPSSHQTAALLRFNQPVEARELREWVDGFGTGTAYIGRAFEDVNGSRMYAEGKVVAMYATQTFDAAQAASAIFANGGTLVEIITLPSTTFVISQYPDDNAMFRAATALHQRDDVAAAEPGFMRVYKHDALIPNDPLFSQQWFLSQSSDADIDAPEAHAIQLGDASVTVAVLDGGFDPNHPDMLNVIVDPYDAAADVNFTTILNQFDRHGTPCMGLIGAVSNNSIGVSSVAPGVKVMTIQIQSSIDADGSFSFPSGTIARAVAHMLDNSSVAIASNSWGSGSPSSEASTAFADFIDNARGGLGGVVLASAGNEGQDNVLRYPASYAGVLSIGATDITDSRASFSNGSDSLDVAAPGVNTYTVDIRGNSGYTNLTAAEPDYTFFGGTSAACPVAAGVAGLIASVNPSLSGYQIASILQTTTDRPSSFVQETREFGEWNRFFGYGRVNAQKAVQAAVITSNEAAADPSDARFRVYPNPVQTQFTLELTTQQSGLHEVTLLDATGRSLYTQTLLVTPFTREYTVTLPQRFSGVGAVVVAAGTNSLGQRKVIFQP